VEEARAAASGVADGTEFRRGRGARVDSTVYVYADESAAMERFQSLAAPDTRRCFAEGIVEKAKAEPDIELSQVDFPALPVERLADESARARLTIPLSGQGVHAVVYADLMLVRAGRAISLGVYMSPYDPFDEDLRAELAAKAANRLQDVLQAGA
jgi:hypothetical protein